jgi:hypothetical protein
MIQIDGGPHDWFEGRSASCTLLVFIDDATGKLTQLRFMPTREPHHARNGSPHPPISPPAAKKTACNRCFARGSSEFVWKHAGKSGLQVSFGGRIMETANA